MTIIATSTTETAHADTITSIEVKNYKGVREILLYPEGGALVLAGKAGQGKSSFIDAVKEVFDPEGTKLTPMPIRIGEDQASIRVTTTSAILERVWKQNDAGTLTAYQLNGKKHKQTGKQFVLEATGGAIFDMDEFVELKDADQRAELLKRVELPFDLVKLEEIRSTYYTERTDVSRTVREASAARAALPTPPAGTPLELQSAAEIITEHAAAQAHNNEVGRRRAAATAAAQSKEAAVARLEQARQAVDQAIAAIEQADAHAATTLSAAQQIAPVDTEAIVARLNSVERINDDIRAAKALAEADARLAAARSKEDELNEKILAIDRVKKQGLEAATFPVKGLGVDDTGVTYNGVPFKQVNTAQQTEVAFDLGTEPQPKLKLLIIKGGNDLDAETFFRIIARAEERGYLAFVERAREDEGLAYAKVISNGYVDGVEPVRRPEPLDAELALLLKGADE